ncbi:hypothetical protein OG393_29085 [Streptomyces sp. NBC_01216]|uniref:hypothetical protein n=1 Tax=Streptomyces sp. NBC_01216 TaxID=2903778 RepID=UPI002E14C1D9|nr:hypothetical protein OG393_29085 [Streptomyces sp. NBC_01216]
MMRLNPCGMVECSDCGMDLGAYPSDYDVGPEGDVYCGHCENERHECPVPVDESAASKVLRDAIARIKWHECQWRLKGVGPDHREFLRSLLGEFQTQAQAGRGSDRPYTVVMDWESDFFDHGADDVRSEYGQDDPVTFHVWAPNASDASDAARERAEETFKEAADYLGSVAVLHGHAPLVRDGE